MTPEDALKLKRGDKVWLQYTPSPGHGVKLNTVAEVTYDVSGPTSTYLGGDYVGVVLRPAGWNHSSVFPSHCISKI